MELKPEHTNEWDQLDRAREDLDRAIDDAQQTEYLRKWRDDHPHASGNPTSMDGMTTLLAAIGVLLALLTRWIPL